MPHSNATLGMQIPNLPRSTMTRSDLYRAIRIGRQDAAVQKNPQSWNRHHVGNLLRGMRERFRAFDAHPALQAVASAAWFHEVSCRTGKCENFYLLSVATQQTLALAFSLLDAESCLNLLDYAPDASGRGPWQATWRPICVGALAQAHVIATLSEWTPGCCKLPHLADDAFRAIDLICGPFKRGRALCLQVKASSMSRFLPLIGPPARTPGIDRFKDERALWHGTARFNRAHGSYWKCALIHVDMRKLPVDPSSVQGLRELCLAYLEPFSKETRSF